MFTCADVARQALDLLKATFDNTYLSLAALQQIGEDALLSVAAGSSLVPAEVDQVLRECVSFGQRVRGDLKDTVDRCHALMHGLIDRTQQERAATAARQQPRSEAATVS